MFRGQSWVKAIGEQYGTMCKRGYIKNAIPEHWASGLNWMCRKITFVSPFLNIGDNLNVGWRNNNNNNNESEITTATVLKFTLDQFGFMSRQCQFRGKMNKQNSTKRNKMNEFHYSWKTSQIKSVNHNFHEDHNFHELLRSRFTQMRLKFTEPHWNWMKI